MLEVHRANKNTRSYLVLVFVGCGFLIAPSLKITPVQLVWNASASVPKGLYRTDKRAPKKGDRVLVRLPGWAALLASKRGYLPRNIPAVKRISATQNDTVCRFGQQVFINQKISVAAKIYDKKDQKMPNWNGCKRLGVGEIFLLAEHPASFDGRYFGITKSTNIIGTLRPVWLITD